jgi:hypothetical protein
MTGMPKSQAAVSCRSMPPPVEGACALQRTFSMAMEQILLLVQVWV